MIETLTVLSQLQFKERLFQELQRARRYNRQFCILVLKFASPDEIAAALETQIRQSIRLVDVVGIDESGNVLFLFPEIGDTAAVPAGRILQTLKKSGVAARGGLAIYPDTATEVTSLLNAAQSTSALAADGSFEMAPRDTRLTDMGDQPVIAHDPVTRRLFALVESLAQSTLPVLIDGETGVGKEIIANALHRWSRRAAGPMVSINCAAMPEPLLESELFGHARGAFSGAVGDKQGLFETAEGGTLFLDEISEAPMRVQAGLLRVLETKRIRRVGANHEKDVNVRIVAATNRKLSDEIENGRFRRDLYYRLCAASVHVPSLTERSTDLPILARVFLDRACVSLGREPVQISENAMERLMAYHWPGNIRELKNLMEYLAATVADEVIIPKNLPMDIRAASQGGAPAKNAPDREESQEISIKAFRPLAEEIAELEQRRIREALIAASGVKVRAARLIDMPLRTLLAKIKKYNLGGGPQDSGTDE